MTTIETIETIAAEHAATYIEQGATMEPVDGVMERMPVDRVQSKDWSALIAEGDLADLVERLGREQTRYAREALTADELAAYRSAFVLAMRASAEAK